MGRPRVPAEQRFWPYVDKSDPDGCWPWLRSFFREGYGRFTLEPGRQVGAHVAAYILTYGEPQYNVLHTCDFRPCCRPDHLYDGTDSDNMRDRAARGWRPLGSQNGQAIMTEDRVIQLRQDADNGASYNMLMDKYDLSRATVCNIVKRKTWRHIAAVLLVVLLGVQPFPIHAHGNTPDDIDTLIHAASSYRHVSYWQMRDVLECESNHWDRRVINGQKHGTQGEVGIAQILPSWTPAAKRYGSLGRLFESRTGDYSASDSIYFMAYAFSKGLRFHWHC